MPPEPAAVDAAARAFLYGYPLVYDLDECAKFVAGAGSFPTSAPYNAFGHVRELAGPELTFVSPNNDTLYSLAVCDVRPGPLILDVPDTAGRYYVLQFVDAWTNNFAYVGRRATGTAAGRFLLAPPGYDGPVPDGAHLIEAPTGVFTIVGRVEVDGEADLPAVHALQDGFTLAPLDRAQAAPEGVPAPDPRVPDELAWWERFRVMLAAFPPPAADQPFLDACAALGLLEAETPYADLDPARAATLVEAARAGAAQIEELMQQVQRSPAGWQSAMHLFDYNLDALGPGTLDDPAWKIADRTRAYVIRAVAARGGLWGNHGYEANYELIWIDEDGQPLDGAGRYELVLQTPPPVDAFWSLTMYDVPDFYLVANPISRFSIGDRTAGLEVAADGSITILMQRDSPGPEREANWLPTPDGAFRPIMRMYQPGADVLEGRYALPAIRRVG